MSFCKRFKIRKTIYPGKALVGYQCPHTFSHSELLKSFSWTIIQPIFLQLLYTWQLLLILDDIAFQCRVHCTVQSKGCGEYILINSKPNFVLTMMVAYSSCRDVNNIDVFHCYQLGHFVGKLCTAVSNGTLAVNIY